MNRTVRAHAVPDETPAIPQIPGYQDARALVAGNWRTPGKIVKWLFDVEGSPDHFRGPVRWLLSRDLLAKARKLVVHALFASELDHRDWMKSVPFNVGAGAARWQSGDPYWFDFVADIGDSQLANYNLAFLMLGALRFTSDDRLEAAPGGIEASGIGVLPRGQFLMIGGDTAYHVADLETLTLRTRAPFEWARRDRQGDAEPAAENCASAPWLFAIPANHDLYDGLIGFNKVFMRPRDASPHRLADFNRAQTASFVCLELPYQFRLIGLDSQDGKLDHRQIQEARSWVGDAEHAAKLIVVTSQPSTVFSAYTPSSVRPFQDLGLPRPFLDSAVQSPAIHLDLSGDIHHYARYQADPGAAGAATTGTPQPVSYVSVVAGGGAFLHPSHTSREHPQGAWPPVPQPLYPARTECATAVTQRLLDPLQLFTGGFVWAIGGLLALVSACGHFGANAAAGGSVAGRLGVVWGGWRAAGLEWPQLILLGLVAVLMLWLGISIVTQLEKSNTGLAAEPPPVKVARSSYHALLVSASLVSGALIGAGVNESFLRCARATSSSVPTALLLLVHLLALAFALAWSFKHAATLVVQRRFQRIGWRDHAVRYAVMAFGAVSAWFGLRLYGVEGAAALSGFVLVMMGAPLALAVLAALHGANGQSGARKLLLVSAALLLATGVLGVAPLLAATSSWPALVASLLPALLLSKGASLVLGRQLKRKSLDRSVFIRGGVLALLFASSLALPLAIAWICRGGGDLLGALPLGSGLGCRSFVAGSVLTSVWFGQYLAVALAFDCHNNEAGSAARLDQFCHFIRFKLEQDRITGYVIGVEKLVTNCKEAPVVAKLIDTFYVGAPPVKR